MDKSVIEVENDSLKIISKKSKADIHHGLPFMTVTSVAHVNPSALVLLLISSDQIRSHLITQGGTSIICL